MVEDKNAARRRELRELRILFIISAVFSAPFLVMMVLMFAAPNAAVTHWMHNAGWLQLALATPVQFVVGWRFYKGAVLSLINQMCIRDRRCAVHSMRCAARSRTGLPKRTRRRNKAASNTIRLE